MAAPPLNGAVNDTVNLPLPTPTVGCAGASGAEVGSVGVTAFDAGEGPLGPSALFAVTVHVYVLPFDNNPTTIDGVVPDAEPDTPPFDDAHSALYPVIGLPPSSSVGEKNTVTCAFPARARGCGGAAGTAAHADGAATTPTSPTRSAAATVAPTPAKRRPERRGRGVRWEERGDGMGYPFGREVGTKGTATVSGGCRVGGVNGTATNGGCVTGGVASTVGGGVTTLRTNGRVAGGPVRTTTGLVDGVVTDAVGGAMLEAVVAAGFFAGVVTRLRVGVA